MNKAVGFWLCWVFIALSGLSLLAASAGYSYCRAQTPGLQAWQLQLKRSRVRAQWLGSGAWA